MSEEKSNDEPCDVGNVEAGTVVDYAITTKDSKEFFLASQMPKQVKKSCRRKTKSKSHYAFVLP